MKLKVVLSISALLMALVISCQSPDALDFDRYYSQGRIIYQTRCQNCHDEHGQGLNWLIPPLTDSAYLKSHRHQLPCYVQNGVSGKMTLKIKTFDGQMPSNSDLANIEIAEVLTYVTNSFGNKMGVFKVESVNQDIQNCR